MSRCRWAILAALAVIAVGLQSVTSAAEPVPLWGRFEVKLVADEKADPETAVAVELVSPSDKKHAIDGFWDGELVWRLRYMPTEEGTWKYTTKSEPAVKGLDQQSGKFECRGRDQSNRFLKHGVLRVAESRTYLEHADGTPFFWMGDTVWTGPAKATLDDWKKFLDDRVAKKFTVIQFNMASPWRTAPTDREGMTAFEGRENIKINPQYYQRLDAFMDAINERGLAASPILVWALKKEDPGNYLPEKDVLKLVRYEVARYGAHHLVWLLAGDNPYNVQSAPRWKRIGREVFGGKPRQPVSTHPTGMNWPWEGWRNEDWIDVFGYQSGHGDDAKTLEWIHSGPVAKNRDNKPVRPIINLEPPYEDHLAYQSRKPHSAYNVRRAVYWSLLASATAGVTYGGHGVWSWQLEPGKTPTDHAGTGVAKVWHEAVHLPGSQQMKYVVEVFESTPWWELRPNQELLESQPGGGDPAKFVAAASTAEGKAAVVYLPVGGKVIVNRERLAKNLLAEWVNPRDGTRQGAKPVEGSTYQAPDEQDWVLVFGEKK